jgi:hypothetical protein
MTNKLKGIIIGFLTFFAFGVIKRVIELGGFSGSGKYGEEFGYFPIFLGFLGLILGFIIGSSIKEKEK